MKKAVVILLLFLTVLGCIGCGKVKNKVDNTTQKITETVADIISTTQEEKTVSIFFNDTETYKELSADESEYIINLLENGQWKKSEPELMVDYFYDDYSFVINENTYHYHVDCFSFTDSELRHNTLTLNDKDKEKIKKIVDEICLSYTPTAPSNFSLPHESSSVDIDHIHNKNYDYYRTENDGVVLEIHLPYVISAGSEFEVCAIVTNTTDHIISYTTPVYSDDSHTEIDVEITDGQNYFTDIDVYGKFFPDAVKTFHLESGESYTQVMHFIPGKYISDSYNNTLMKYYDNGKYKGTAMFDYYYLEGGDVHNPDSVSLEFEVNIVEKASNIIID